MVERVRGGTRRIARAITLVESSRADHRELTQELLVQLAPYAGKATRIGISGVPGVGKSTFIDAFGSMLTARGHRVAVLAVDPSSTRTGGSILGDKTRMARLAVDPHAFVRPSPTGGRLGGVARATRETMVLVEAAGYDVVLVETVGVGQSEVAVADMVDTFLLLALARTGDQLQAIKKGILELADVIAVNKADGEGAIEAGVTARDLTGAMRMMRSADPAASSWRVPVLTCSGLTGAGLDDVWDAVQRHQQAVSESGSLQERRSRQHVEWMWSLVSDQLLAALHADPAVRAVLPGTEAEVRRGGLTAAAAAQQLLDVFLGEQPAAPTAQPACPLRRGRWSRAWRSRPAGPAREGVPAPGHHLGPECGHHRAVVGAQARAAAPAAGSRPRRTAPAASARSRELAATPPPMRRSSTPCSWQASTALRVSTSATASWKLAATSATGTGSPDRSRASTQRATAVFSPENEKSNRCRSMSLRDVRPAREVDRHRAALARHAVHVRSAGERQPEHAGDLVERLTGGVVDGAAERAHVVGDVGDQQQDGVAAARPASPRGLRQRAVLELCRPRRGPPGGSRRTAACRARRRAPWPRRHRRAGRRPGPGRR